MESRPLVRRAAGRRGRRRAQRRPAARRRRHRAVRRRDPRPRARASGRGRPYAGDPERSRARTAPRCSACASACRRSARRSAVAVVHAPCADARQDVGDHARRPRRCSRALPSPFTATRYHSLVCCRTREFPAALRACASSEDGVVQGLAHRELPIAGVQFHPESVLTVEGRVLAENVVAGMQAVSDRLSRAVARRARRRRPAAQEMAATIGAIMDETLTPVRAAALLAALAAKGETVDEVVGAARAMRERSVRVEHGLPMVLDVVGTGGDNAHTINISTAAAFIVAGCDVPVAKHGNRAASSACGSADVLEALGVAIDRSPEASARVLREHNIAFLFAQRHHPRCARSRRSGASSACGPSSTCWAAHEPRGRDAPSRGRRPARARGHRRRRAAFARRRSGRGGPRSGRARRDFGRSAHRGRAVRRAASGAGRSTRPRTAYARHVPDPRRRPRHERRRAGGDPRGRASPARRPRALNAALALVVASEAVGVEDGIARARTAVETGRARAALDALRGERNGSDKRTKGPYDGHARQALRRQGGGRAPRTRRASRTTSCANARGTAWASAVRSARRSARRKVRRSSPRSSALRPRSDSSCANLDPAEIARAYEAAGADAISVLTEADHFLGDLAYVDIARAATRCRSCARTSSLALRRRAVRRVRRRRGPRDRRRPDRRGASPTMIDEARAVRARRAGRGAHRNRAAPRARRGRETARHQQPQPAHVRDRPGRHRGAAPARAAATSS